jgi:formylglycine-generating enzyme required for sulfatase activity
MQSRAARSTEGMNRLDGGDFLMGSNKHYPEEAPAHRVIVDPFWIDVKPVTNRDFAQFVAATGHVTCAEVPPDPADYPGALPEMLRAGSLLFTQPGRPVDLRDWSQWWEFSFGADWRHPLGPDSSIEGLEDHPVVHVNFADAEAYATWIGKSLPTEAEWEFASRGGLDGEPYAWGAEYMPGGVPQANTWQGAFPNENLLEDGYMRTSPVGVFPPNGYGLYDMIGNVWEWTTDFYAAAHKGGSSDKPCCAPRNPRGAALEESFSPHPGALRIPRKVLKGGSHLCAPNYCQRYRPAARHAQDVDTSTSHIGFRCVMRDGEPVA